VGDGISNDLDNLKYSRIRDFDAVFLNSTVGRSLSTPRCAPVWFASFAKAADSRTPRRQLHLHGLAGIQRMIGASEGPHRIESRRSRWTTSRVHSRVLRRQNVRLGGRVSTTSTRTAVLAAETPRPAQSSGARPGPEHWPPPPPDHDYGLSWIHNYGKGRVFFCALGHTPALYTSPAMVRHILAGVQYILAT